MVSKVAPSLCFIALCVLSLPIRAKSCTDSKYYDDKEEFDRLFGASLEENIDKLKAVVDTAVNLGLESVKNAANAVDKYLSRISVEHGPAIAKVIIDLGKGLVGLKTDLDRKHIPTNICFIDEAVKKVDTLPNDVGRQVQICKKTVAAQIAKYLDKTQENLEEATAEGAALAKSGLDCIRELNLLCAGRFAVKIAGAIFKIPNELTKQVSDTVELIGSLQKRGAICLTKTIERAFKKVSGYVDKVEECLRNHNVHFEPLLSNS